MSYCRFSSDDFQCDLYCYEDVAGGFTTHVAGIRFIFKEPLPAPIILDDSNVKEWWVRNQVVSGMIDEADRVPLNLPHDGETFNDPDFKSLLGRIIYLKSLGYRVPDSVIEAIMGELKEEKP
jgi:hypothetical protein